MKVRNLDIWGTNKDDILRYGKKYSVYSKVIYIADILITIIVLHTMFKRGVYFGDYLRFMLLSFIVCGLALNIPLNENKYSTYKFIKKYGKYEYDCKTFSITQSDMYSCLYKTYKSKLKKNDLVEYYLSVVDMTCQKNIKYSSKFMTNLVLLENNDKGTKFTVYYLKKGKKEYYLKSELINECNIANSDEVDKDAKI